MQTHHIIRCSHKHYKHRHFNQHMIFQYCGEGTGEPVQTCRLPRAFAASTRDFDIYTLSCDFACANVHIHQSIRCWREKHTNRHLSQHKRFCTVTKAKVSLCKCADSPNPSLLAQIGIQLTFESPHENFEL